MRCDRCHVVAPAQSPDGAVEADEVELRPTTICTLNPYGQLSGYFEGASTSDLCGACRDLAEAYWNQFTDGMSATAPGHVRDLVGEDLGVLRDRIERLGEIACIPSSTEIAEVDQIIDSIFTHLADLELTLVPLLAPGARRLDESRPGVRRQALIEAAGLRSAERQLADPPAGLPKASPRSGP